MTIVPHRITAKIARERTPYSGGEQRAAAILLSVTNAETINALLNCV